MTEVQFCHHCWKWWATLTVYSRKIKSANPQTLHFSNTVLMRSFKFCVVRFVLLGPERKKKEFSTFSFWTSQPDVCCSSVIVFGLIGDCYMCFRSLSDACLCHWSDRTWDSVLIRFLHPSTHVYLGGQQPWGAAPGVCLPRGQEPFVLFFATRLLTSLPSSLRLFCSFTKGTSQTPVMFFLNKPIKWFYLSLQWLFNHVFFLSLSLSLSFCVCFAVFDRAL